jgi:hypothetical protein
MKHLLAIVVILLLAGLNVRADIVSVPPKKLTLAGTLAWTPPRTPAPRDAEESLTLTTAEGKSIRLLWEHQVKNRAQYDQFLGKKVVVTVLAYEANNARGGKEIIVRSISDIVAAPAPKR